MDIATIIGLLLAFGMMAVSVLMGGGNFASFWDTASVLMVIGGTFGAILICYPLRVAAKIPKVLLKTALNKPPNIPALIQEIVELSDTARRQGLLSLESRIAQISDPFIRTGIQLTIDGTPPDLLETVLRTEVETMALRHKEGKALIDQIGKFAPAFGMVGTLMGLIIMLGNMSDPSSIGSGMAVALITTLYGAVLSNGSFLPLAEKLGYISKQELIAREIAIRGILALQAGDNPRIIQQKLQTFLPPSARPKES